MKCCVYGCNSRESEQFPAIYGDFLFWSGPGIYTVYAVDHVICKMEQLKMSLEKSSNYQYLMGHFTRNG